MSFDLVVEPLSQAVPPDLFPLERLNPPEGLRQVMDRVLVTHWQEASYDPLPGGRLDIGLTAAEEVVLELPGLSGFALVVGGPNATTLGISLEDRGAGGSVTFTGGVR